MEAIIKLILQAYMMEGIKASDVAMLVSKEGGMDIVRCMSPQQHHSGRAIGVKQRLERQLTSYPSEVHVQPGKVVHEGVAMSMYIVVVSVKM